jgi:uncharacterized membrane protein
VPGRRRHAARYVGPMPQPSNGPQEAGEDDEARNLADNSLGRLLTLCDGVFAIAMTLLTFDLKVPDIGGHPTDATLRHALAHQTSGYLSFALSFYLIASYWRRHRRLMRSVVASHPRLVNETIFLLFIIAAMPFLTSLLGQHGSDPIALSLYGAGNAIAVVTLVQINRSLRRYKLLDGHPDAVQDPIDKWDMRRNLLVFILCIPAGYVARGHGPWILVLLAVPLHFRLLQKFKRRHQAAPV